MNTITSSPFKDTSQTKMSTTIDCSNICVYNVESNDVLLGRGAPIINNKGNIKFRKVVNARKAEYMASCRHDIKNKIANEVINIIASRNGRFLRRVEDSEEALKLGISVTDESVWVVADEYVSLQKVKQALREQGSKHSATNTSAAVKFKKKLLAIKEDSSNVLPRNDIPLQESSTSHLLQLPGSNGDASREMMFDNDLLILKARQEIQNQELLKEMLRRRREIESSFSFQPSLAPFPLTLSSSARSPDRGQALDCWAQTLARVSPHIAADLNLSQSNGMISEFLTPSNIHFSDVIRYQNQMTALALNDRIAMARSLLSPQTVASHGYQVHPLLNMRSNMALDGIKERDMYAMLAHQMPGSNPEQSSKRQRTQY
jgi:hypothetical protein